MYVCIYIYIYIYTYTIILTYWIRYRKIEPLNARFLESSEVRAAGPCLLGQGQN